MKRAAEITGVEAEVLRRVYLRHSRVQTLNHSANTQTDTSGCSDSNN